MPCTCRRRNGSPSWLPLADRPIWLLSAGAAEPALRLAAALGPFWRVRGYVIEGQRLLDAALAQGKAVDSGVEARARYAAGYLAMERRHLQVAAEHFAASLVS